MVAYLDHAATTPLHPEVLEEYARALAVVGNPSSIHSHGQQAKRMLEEAREQLAEVLGCHAMEIVFTSGGTEAINLAIKGTYWARNKNGERPLIVMPAGEHHATLDTVEWLVAAESAELRELPIDSEARVLPDVLQAALAEEGDRVAVATVIWANNEVGTVQPIEELAAVAGRYGVPLHSDAVGALGSVPVDFRASALAAMSVSAHKIGGPVGVGALVLARSASVVPLLHGGGQQRKVRSGTQDVAGAVAFARAARLAADRLSAQTASVTELRDELIRGVRAIAPDAVLRGSIDDRLPGNAHFTFPGCDGDSLLFLLDTAGVSVSTGSACTAGVSELSHVLLGMGIDEADARGALRMTLGEGSTRADVEAFLTALPDAVARARRAGHSSREPSIR